MIVNRRFGTETFSEKEPGLRRELLASALIGFSMGCYDGIVGPGTGTFTILLFTGFLYMDLLTASGCAKVSNLASNVAAAVIWIKNGMVLWPLAVPAVICSVAGNLLGARFAIEGGGRRVRQMLFVVLGLLFVKILYDLIF